MWTNVYRADGKEFNPFRRRDRRRFGEPLLDAFDRGQEAARRWVKRNKRTDNPFPAGRRAEEWDNGFATYVEGRFHRDDIR